MTKILRKMKYSCVASWLKHAGLDCRKDVRRYLISSRNSRISYLAVIVENDPVGKATTDLAREDDCNRGGVVFGGCPV
jgi:hypothetical protein